MIKENAKNNKKPSSEFESLALCAEDNMHMELRQSDVATSSKRTKDENQSSLTGSNDRPEDNRHRLQSSALPLS
jgi:hypothetical protein